MKKITLKEVAAAAGVSIVTVSNALSGKAGVSEDERKRIIFIARKMKFDFSRYSKKQMESMTIGVIVSERYIAVGTSFYWEMYQKTAYAATENQGYTMLEILTAENEKEGILPQTILSRNIDGLIVIGKMNSAYMKEIIQVAEVPVVLLDFYNDAFQCEAVLSNNYVGMYKATRYLIEKGHREIGFIGSVEVTENIRDRYYGYKRAMTEAGLTICPEWILGDRNIETDEIVIRLPEKLPTAFACSSDYAAGNLYDELIKNKLRVPQDISLIGYDNYLYDNPLGRILTSYDVDMDKMAYIAVEMVKKGIDRKEKEKTVHYVDSSIIERTSVQDIGNKKKNT